MKMKSVEFESGLEMVDVLEMAKDALLHKWYKEAEKIKRLEEKGMEAPIAHKHEAEYWKQLKEIEALLEKCTNSTLDYQMVEIDD